MSYIEVWELAQECRVKSGEVLEAAQELGIPLYRVAAKLNGKQADRLRSYFAAKEKGRRLKMAAPTTRSSTVPAQQPLRPRQLRIYNVPAGPTVPRGCACCGMRFEQAAGEIKMEHYCPICRSHYRIDDEDEVRQLARLRDHDERLRRGYEPPGTARMSTRNA